MLRLAAALCHPQAPRHGNLSLLFQLCRAFHASAALQGGKGGRESKGAPRPTPRKQPPPPSAAPAAASKGPKGAAPPASREDDAGGGNGEEEEDEEGGGGKGGKEGSLQELLARQVSFCKRELDKIRGSTPSVGILDGVSVQAYGESRPLQEVAQVVLRGPSTLVVSPFDGALAGAIAEAIRAAELGLNPQEEGGGVLRVPVPKASKETREAAAKLVAKIGEQAKVRVRRVRASTLLDLKARAGVSEDDAKRDVEAVEKQVAAAVAEVTKMAEAKRLVIEKQ
jgi:ribosome recycling factor